MNDHIPPNKTLRGFLKFTYWDLPNTMFGRWTLVWMYLLPCLLLFWLTGQKPSLTVRPQLQDLSVVEGKAEFEQSRNRTLQLRLPDGGIFKFDCASQKNNTNPCSYIGEKFAEENKNKRTRIWMHPDAGALQIEINGHILEMHSFKSMSAAALDAATSDDKKLYAWLYVIALFLVLPLYSTIHFFKFGK